MVIVDAWKFLLEENWKNICFWEPLWCKSEFYAVRFWVSSILQISEHLWNIIPILLPWNFVLSALHFHPENSLFLNNALILENEYQKYSKYKGNGAAFYKLLHLLRFMKNPHVRVKYLREDQLFFVNAKDRSMGFLFFENSDTKLEILVWGVKDHCKGALLLAQRPRACGFGLGSFWFSATAHR